MGTILNDHGSVGSTIESELSLSRTDSKYFYLFPNLVDTEFHRPLETCPEYFANLELFAIEMDAQTQHPSQRMSMPAVYTYFGQFMNHDLSAPMATPEYLRSVVDKATNNSSADEIIASGPDAVALMTAKRPPNPQWLIDNILNQHPEPLSLYSLYGTGPSSDNSAIRELYDDRTMKFQLGKTFDDPAFPQSELDKMVRHDLVRNAELGFAKIADRRNDENVILGQLHLAFMLFHNKTIDVLQESNRNLAGAQLFAEARALVTRHYQYCIVHDYLKLLVPDETLSPHFDRMQRRAVPFEFTTAAFRFGHSMISSSYDYNRFFGIDGSVSPMATLLELFQFTTNGKMGGDPANNGQLPTHWVIDWERFIKSSDNPLSGAECIDMHLPGDLVTLPDSLAPMKRAHGLSSICHRNLKRGYHRFMPSGQELARALGETPLTPAEIKTGFSNMSAQNMLGATGFDLQTPPWAYFLCEAKVRSSGKTLGPTAGKIIRGTIMTLLKRNPFSALSFDSGRWTPEQSPLRTPDGHAVKDIKSFLQFAGVLGK